MEQVFIVCRGLQAHPRPIWHSFTRTDTGSRMNLREHGVCTPSYILRIEQCYDINGNVKSGRSNLQFHRPLTGGAIESLSDAHAKPQSWEALCGASQAGEKAKFAYSLDS